MLRKRKERKPFMHPLLDNDDNARGRDKCARGVKEDLELRTQFGSSSSKFFAT